LIHKGIHWTGLSSSKTGVTWMDPPPTCLSTIRSLFFLIIIGESSFGHRPNCRRTSRKLIFEVPSRVRLISSASHCTQPPILLPEFLVFPKPDPSATKNRISGLDVRVTFRLQPRISYYQGSRKLVMTTTSRNATTKVAFQR
jgi:hypothetical protein